MELYKKVGGFESLMDTYDESFLELVWYRFFIVFHNDEIKVYKQSGDIRQIDLIWNLKNSDVQRGTVALSTDGSAAGIFFDAWQVTDYNPVEGVISEKYVEHRSFPKCLLPASKSKRNLFFQKRYHTKEDGKHKNLIIGYCGDCCSSYVDTWERLIHYSCVKSCISVTRNYERELREKAGIPEFEVWIPKAGEFVDYRIEGKEGYIPAEITGTEPDADDPNVIVAVLKYPTANGRYKENVYVPMPSESLKKCGMMIDGREDCDG